MKIMNRSLKASRCVFFAVFVSAFTGSCYAADLNWSTGNWGDTFAPDFDGDGYEDVIDAFISDPTEWADLDMDGIGNNGDWDADGDNVIDTVDSDPLNAGNATELNLSIESDYKGTAFSTDIN